MKQTTTKQHKKLIIILDILMILGIVTHFGAYTITNYLVAKTTPEPQFIEVNPAAAFTYDLQQAPQPQRNNLLLKLLSKISHFIILGIALGVYIWMRYKANHPRDYLIMSIAVSTWFTIFLLNLSNDLGFLISSL